MCKLGEAEAFVNEGGESGEAAAESYCEEHAQLRGENTGGTVFAEEAGEESYQKASGYVYDKCPDWKCGDRVLFL